jgi:S-adenosyl methyltransferase
MIWGDGIRQFLDIGTGLPSANNTHEVAQRMAPQSRVVYVDNDRCKSGCAHEYLSGQATFARRHALEADDVLP